MRAVPASLPNLEALAAIQEEEQAADGKPTQAQWLIAYGREHGELWRTPEGEAYMTYRVHEHREHAPIRSGPVRDWLRLAYHREFGKPPGAQALQDALETLAAIARYDGPTYPVFVRVGHLDGTVYLDLCDDSWQAVEVTAGGWRVVADPPVRFRRARGMLPLPVPVAGGSVERLRSLLPAWEDDAWLLLVSWAVAALAPRGPYPVLILQGEQGSGKSTVSRMLRGLVDPNTAALRSVPREERDLLITARNGWVIALDNLSGAPVWLSDGLCRLATGGGWSTRELYTDTDEVLINVQRPVLLNGIDDIATRDDLRDRAIILHLPPISDEQRRDEDELWREYERVRPRVLSALLDAVSMGLRRWDETKLPWRPRMADYARWIAAAEPALPWEAGAHLDVYAGNRKEAAAVSLESNAVAQAVLALMERREEWEGTATELLAALEQHASERAQRSKQWPGSARALSGRLRRVAPLLRQAGLEVEWSREPGSGGRRLITLRKKTKDDTDRRNRRNRRLDTENPHDDGTFVATQSATVCDGRPFVPSPLPSHQKPAPEADCDEGDGRDANSAAFSTEREVFEL